MDSERQRDQDKEEILRCFTAERLAQYLAEKTGGTIQKSGKGYRIDDKKRIKGIGGLTVYTEAGKAKWKIQNESGSDSTGDIFEAIGRFDGIQDFPGQKERAAEIANITLPDNGQAHKATANKGGKWTLEATYGYTDAEGNPVREKRRYNGKRFVWYHRDRTGKSITGAGDGPPLLYRLPEVIETAAKGRTVWITEGEKDADTLADKLLTATTGEHGGTKGDPGKKWHPEYTEALRGAHCIIIADADSTGRPYAQTIAAAITGTAASVKVIECPKGKDATEFFEQGGTLAELVSFAENAPEWTPEAERVSNWAEAAARIGEITWSWPGWMPNGLLTMLVSESGKGKSALALRIAACFIRGDKWPDGSPFTGKTGCVVWCESEGALSVNVDRARKAGVPFERMLSPLADPLEEFNLDNPEHVERLRVMAARPDVQCIILDSLSGATQQDENSSVMLHSVKKLAAIAAESGKPFLLLHHLNKGISDGDGVHQRQIRGSSAIIQTARAVWAIDAPDDTDDTHRRLSVVKNNLAAYAPPVGFRIAEGGITFTGEAPRRRRTDTVKDIAADFLLDTLANGPVPSSEIDHLAKERGISPNAIARAKKEIDADSERRDGRWFFFLKSDRTPPPDNGRGMF